MYLKVPADWQTTYGRPMIVLGDYADKKSYLIRVSDHIADGQGPVKGQRPIDRYYEYFPETGPAYLLPHQLAPGQYVIEVAEGGESVFAGLHVAGYDGSGKGVRFRGFNPPLPIVNLVEGGAAFLSPVSDAHFDLVERHAAISPWHTVLEIGCPVSGLGLRLLDRLSSGRYVGVDSNRVAVAWCTEKCAARGDDFAFVHADYADPLRNPEGSLFVQDLTLPVTTGSVDRVYVHALLYQLFEGDARRLLAEVRRVLRPGGLAVFNTLLIDPATLEALQGSDYAQNVLKLTHPAGEGCFSTDPGNSFAGVGYALEKMAEMIVDAELRLAQPIHYGQWSGYDLSRSDRYDVLVLTRSE